MTRTTGSRAAGPDAATKPSPVPGLLMGLGLGGFVDGIVLHQILQWHHMASSTDGNPVDTVAGLETNVLADGLFHAATWLFVLLGMFGLLAAWRAGPARTVTAVPPRPALTGWGVFNVVEGVIDHQILGVHHVRDDLGGPLSLDIGFLVFGVLLIVVGWSLYKAGGKQMATHVSSRGPGAPASSGG